jgi:hypothetical protein
MGQMLMQSQFWYDICSLRLKFVLRKKEPVCRTCMNTLNSLFTRFLKDPRFCPCEAFVVHLCM